MSAELSLQINNTILRLENAVQNQAQLDQLWADVKNLLVEELDTLPNLPISNCKKQNKLFKKSQTFWNENLATAWSNVCRSESEYLLFKANKNGNLAQRNNLKNIYKNFPNIFDSKF